MSEKPLDTTAMLLGNEYMRAFTYRRKRMDGTVLEERLFFRPLSVRDMHLARINAEQRVKKLLGTEKFEDAVVQELTTDQRNVEIIHLACRSEKDPALPWKQVVELEHMPQVEISLLANAYLAFEQECGPVEHELTIEKLEHWIQRAAEGDTDFLAWSASHTRKAFVMLTARELLSLRADKLSSTSLETAASKPSGSDSSATATMGDIDALEVKLGAEMDARFAELHRAIGAGIVRQALTSPTEADLDPDDGGPVVDHG